MCTAPVKAAGYSISISVPGSVLASPTRGGLLHFTHAYIFVFKRRGFCTLVHSYSNTTDASMQSLK